MPKKKNEIELDDLLDSKKEEAKEVESKEEIKEDELVAKPVKGEPLQTFANEPAQPFNKPEEVASKGVGGSYYIDAQGKRVKRTN